MMISRPVDGVRSRYFWPMARHLTSGRSVRCTAVRVMVFHGYLLQGTGSNVYNAALAAAFVRAGHEVHLLCQDRTALALDWVDAAGSWDSGRLELEVEREPPRATVYRPDIGGLLPVYVRDRYDGLEARPYPELSDAELEDYVARNAAAVAE